MTTIFPPIPDRLRPLLRIAFMCGILATLPILCDVYAADEPPAARDEARPEEAAEPAATSAPAPAEQPVTFAITTILVERNTLFASDRLQEVMAPFVGDGKTADDVEKAREALEKFHHDQGYPTVIVNIPEQSVEEGIIRLQVVEQRINTVTVTGNRYFSREMILGKFPSLQPGGIPHVPTLQAEFTKAGRNPDLKITPAMAPSREVGYVDVELKIEEKLPLHGSLELNNRSSHDTSALRLNGAIRYDNLWQREHSVGLQYQTAPEKTREVQILSGSYVLPDPWHDDRRIVFYGVWSDTNTFASLGDMQVLGKGIIVGGRYLIPLAGKGLYNHSATLGIDYKRFDESAGFKTRVSYLPLSTAYDASLQDSTGYTLFNAGLNFAFRGAVTDQSEMAVKRSEAKGNYLAAILGLERQQKLPLGMGLRARIDGQLSSEPLIPNEQFVAGGMDSVRGYKESEALGDNGFHGTVELRVPDITLGSAMSMTPYVFYDMAAVELKKPLPGENRSQTLQGTGAGVRGMLFKFLEYQVDFAVALSDSDRIKEGDQRVHFRVSCAF
ncbi:Polypeptide-transport-associated domain protein ShlB-type [Geobacter metallireducens RCH3]|uniref:Outer membrane protein n=1 Tax=Geobacter metallireducens (strain ATCC 53774 / DSM 7210 / GS-15) TaxID=269799 RepID=Q39VN3_GEOMG|nr:ShlB/FhaC/HecB family hemolysin secretion/activation protein [Geobacter metallireducens]ABB31691.1 outer membrane protein [Geobacter metallireducens GS-15]EHP89434.1 Polypeptide-transport-associated domain protein ShlB-type [Geobacter metallireducens RCH3]